MKNRVADRYFSEVKSSLLCDRKHRAALLNKARERLDSFAAESPEVDYEAFLSAFGPPEDFVRGMVTDEEVRKARIRRKWFRRSLVAVLVVLLIALAVFWYYKYKDSQAWNNITYVMVTPVKEISNEEFWNDWDEVPECAKSYDEGE